MTTVEPSGRCSSRSSVAIDTSAAAASTCSSPDSGWSDTYRPSISRSNASRCFLSQSGRSGTTTAKPCAPSSPPIRSANRSNWPSASLRFTPMTESTACSCTSSSARRAWPSESNAPALMSDSMVRLLQTTAGTLSRKSVKDVNAPFSSRARTIASTTFAPTLRTAVRPNRMSLPTAVKLADDEFTSGGEHRDAHVPALAQVQRRLVLVVAHAGEQRGHVLGRVVGLEVRGPVRDDAVRRGVRLVEGVVGERQQDVPERSGSRPSSSRARPCRPGRARTPCPAPPSSSCPSRGAACRPGRASTRRAAARSPCTCSW